MAPALWLRLLLAGHLGTLAVLVAWYGWLSPSAQLPTALVLLVLGLPLLLPLRGLLHGRRYTAAWSLFLAIAYSAHALIEFYSSPADRLYAGIELVTTLTWFIAGIGYVRATREA